VINAMGRLFMDAMEDPFAAIDRELDACPLGTVADFAMIDFHAEATSEKQAIGAHVDGRATLVVGTHTHVPTADHRVLPGGTAYQSDTGMCGTMIPSSVWTRVNRCRGFSPKCRRRGFRRPKASRRLAGLAVQADRKPALRRPARRCGLAGT
jgi:calcineurin-like phosphoesterase